MIINSEFIKILSMKNSLLKKKNNFSKISVFDNSILKTRFLKNQFFVSVLALTIKVSRLTFLNTIFSILKQIFWKKHFKNYFET